MGSSLFRRILFETGAPCLARAMLLCVTILLTSATAKDRHDQVEGQKQNQRDSLKVQVAQAEQRNFSIPAQPLTNALTTFGQQSGLQVTFDAAIARNIQSHSSPVVAR